MNETYLIVNLVEIVMYVVNSNDLIILNHIFFYSVIIAQNDGLAKCMAKLHAKFDDMMRELKNANLQLIVEDEKSLLPTLPLCEVKQLQNLDSSIEDVEGYAKQLVV